MLIIKKNQQKNENSMAFQVSLPDSEVPGGIISEYMMEWKPPELQCPRSG